MLAPADVDVARIARIASEHWPEPTDEDAVRRENPTGATRLYESVGTRVIELYEKDAT